MQELLSSYSSWFELFLGTSVRNKDETGQDPPQPSSSLANIWDTAGKAADPVQ